MISWIPKSELMSISGWSSRHVEREAKAGRLTVRASSSKSANGRSVPEYMVGSLPAELQDKYFEMALRRAAALPPADAGAANTTTPLTPLLRNSANLPSVVSPNVNLQQGLFPPPIEHRLLLPAHLEAQARERFAAIEPLLDYARGAKQFPLQLAERTISSLDDLAAWIAEQHDVSQSTIWRWYCLYKKGNTPAVLANRARSDEGKSRYFDANPVLATYAKKLYLADGASIRTAHNAIARECLKRGLETPSYETVRCYLKSLPEPIKAFAREGERQYHERFEPFLLKRYDDKLPNDIWVSDHMLHDCWVKNDGYFDDLPKWAALRVWLTAIEDYRSRKILGFCFSVNPSSATIATALRQAVIAYGPPQEVFYVDNGKDFKAIARTDPFRPELNGALDKLGVATQHCKPRWPQSKHVERFFGTLHEMFDKQWGPAYSGKSPNDVPEACRNLLKVHKKLVDRDRGEESPLPLASEFIQLATHWIARRYNAEHHHHGQGMDERTPDAVFDEGYPAEQRRQLAAEQIAALDIVFRKATKRVVREGGCVELNRQRYEPADAASSAALFQQIERDVMVACDPHNIAEAIVTDLNGCVLGKVQASALMTHGPISQEQVSRIERHRAALRREMKKYVGSLVAITEARGQYSELDILRQEAGVAKGVHRIQRVRSLPAAAAAAALPAPSPTGYKQAIQEILEED